MLFRNFNDLLLISMPAKCPTSTASLPRNEALFWQPECALAWFVEDKSWWRCNSFSIAIIQYILSSLDYFLQTVHLSQISSGFLVFFLSPHLVVYATVDRLLHYPFGIMSSEQAQFDPAKDSTLENPEETPETVTDSTEETPKEAESPIAEDTPVEKEGPATEETPAETDSPTTEETPAQTESPITEDKSYDADQPTEETADNSTDTPKSKKDKLTDKLHNAQDKIKSTVATVKDKMTPSS